MEDRFSLKLSQEEGIILLTSARLLDRLVAGVTIHAKQRDELIKEIIEKLAASLSPALVSMSDELAGAIVESVLGLDEQDDYEPHLFPNSNQFVEASSDGNSLIYPMYAIDKTLPVLEKALIDHIAVRVNYYSFVRESVDLLTLDPLTILKEKEFWKMVAYCHEKDEILVFKVDRIRDAVETTLHFEAPINYSQLNQSPIASYC